MKGHSTVTGFGFVSEMALRPFVHSSTSLNKDNLNINLPPKALQIQRNGNSFAAMWKDCKHSHQLVVGGPRPETKNWY